jgi:hypothetical protein
MKKIMFSDKHGLTAAVLVGTKTQTRRIINVMPKAYGLENETGYVHLLDGYTVVAESRFKFGEVVAVAQPYKDIRGKSDKYLNEWCGIVACDGMDTVGYDNKMFVRADLMPHKIKITDIRVERLQDISDEDCLAEGIITKIEGKFEVGNGYGWNTTIERLKRDTFLTPRAAYAELIDKISGKGTWERNPYCFCYTFKLVK